MDKKKPTVFSLYIKMLVMVLLGAVVAMAAYFAISGVGTRVVQDTYTTQQKATQRLETSKYEFKKYVRENAVSSKDAQAISEWTMEEEYVTVYVYEEYRLTIQAGPGGVSNFTANNNPTTISDSDMDESFFKVKFADGVYLVSMYEYSERAMYEAVETTAFVAACAAFIFVMLGFINRIIINVRRLSRNAWEMGQGNLEKPIVSRGKDEIAVLAHEMDAMRLSILERMENERIAMEANRDLITAVSHDIRTPLTTMLGYLDLIEEGQYADREQMDKYIETVHSKGMQLKELTDRLFRYFLAYSKNELKPEMQRYDADILVEQMLGESVAELRDLGYRVLNDMAVPQGYMLSVDARFLKRIGDNITSNIKKHADKEQRVIFWARIEDDKLSIYAANSIPETPNTAESTKIGLRICEKLAQQMNGKFLTYVEGRQFAAEVILPVEPALEEQES